jgi:hypothetical protein
VRNGNEKENHEISWMCLVLNRSSVQRKLRCVWHQVDRKQKRRPHSGGFVVEAVCKFCRIELFSSTTVRLRVGWWPIKGAPDATHIITARKLNRLRVRDCVYLARAYCLTSAKSACRTPLERVCVLRRISFPECPAQFHCYKVTLWHDASFSRIEE